MCDLVVLFIHLITTIARLAGPGGARSVVAESVLVKQQLLILNRSRNRSPNLRVCDRVVAGLGALLMRPGRLIRSAIVLKPSTLLSLHRTLKNRKYRLLFSLKLRKKPGPKGRSPGSHSSGCPNEATESNMGLSAYRSTNRFGFRYSNQQGCGSADSRCSLPTRPRLGWSFMAHFPRLYEGQPLEPRPLSMRIRNLANTLGSGRDGPIHAAHCWAWCSRRHRGWKKCLEDHLELLRCYYNFVRPHMALKFGREMRMPAIQAGLTTRRLTLREIFPPAILLWLSEKASSDNRLSWS
jgi:hypothetical protein